MYHHLSLAQHTHTHISVCSSEDPIGSRVGLEEEEDPIRRSCQIGSSACLRLVLKKKKTLLKDPIRRSYQDRELGMHAPDLSISSNTVFSIDAGPRTPSTPLCSFTVGKALSCVFRICLWDLDGSWLTIMATIVLGLNVACVVVASVGTA